LKLKCDILLSNFGFNFNLRRYTLVGGSGSGKSTIFHLLQHFYEPSSGFVALDGVDVSQLSHRWQGLTLVHFSAQFKCPLWDRGCMLGVFTGGQGVLGSV